MDYKNELRILTNLLDELEHFFSTPDALANEKILIAEKSLASWLLAASRAIEEIFGDSSFHAEAFKNLENQYTQSRQQTHFESLSQLRKEYIERGKDQIKGMIHTLKILSQYQVKINQMPHVVRWFYNNGNSYTIGSTLFWAVLIPSLSLIAIAGFMIGNTKYDLDKSRLLDENKTYQIKLQTLKQKIIEDSIMFSSKNNRDSINNTSKIVATENSIKSLKVPLNKEVRSSTPSIKKTNTINIKDINQSGVQIGEKNTMNIKNH